MYTIFGQSRFQHGAPPTPDLRVFALFQRRLPFALKACYKERRIRGRASKLPCCRHGCCRRTVARGRAAAGEFIMKFLGIQNCEAEDFGLFQDYLPDLGVAFDIFRAYEGDDPPPHKYYDAVLVGGAPASVNDMGNYPFLGAEEHYVHSVLKAGKSCLGICLGGQLLAKALGAEVRDCNKKEIGVVELDLTPAGKASPLLEGFPSRFPVFQWHGETFDVPPSGVLLARGYDCANQMFRHGSAVGVQFHLEINPEQAGYWSEVYAGELRDFGKTPEQVLSEIRAVETRLGDLARRFLSNFIHWARIQRTV